MYVIKRSSCQLLIGLLVAPTGVQATSSHPPTLTLGWNKERKHLLDVYGYGRGRYVLTSRSHGGRREQMSIKVCVKVPSTYGAAPD